MSDQIQLAIGARPWEPSPDSRLVKEYDRYDMPTAGVLRQSGCLFLFECVEGIVLDINVWVYTLLRNDEEGYLSGLSGNALTGAMKEIWHSRDVAVALASGDAIQTGGTVSQEEIERRGIRGAALNKIQSLLRQETMMAGALETAAG